MGASEACQAVLRSVLSRRANVLGVMKVRFGGGVVVEYGVSLPRM